MYFKNGSTGGKGGLWFISKDRQMLRAANDEEKLVKWCGAGKRRGGCFCKGREKEKSVYKRFFYCIKQQMNRFSLLLVIASLFFPFLATSLPQPHPQPFGDNISLSAALLLVLATREILKKKKVLKICWPEIKNFFWIHPKRFYAHSYRLIPD